MLLIYYLNKSKINNYSIYSDEEFYAEKYNEYLNICVKYSYKIKIVKYISLDIKNEEFYEIIFTIFKKSNLDAKKIYEKNIDISRNSLEKAKATLYSIITKHTYENNDFFDLCSDFLIELLMKHKLKTGNKRTAFMFLIQFLTYSGWYFKYSGGTIINYKKHQNKLIQFIEKFENLNYDNIKYNKEKLKIKKWIMENVLISFK